MKAEILQDIKHNQNLIKSAEFNKTLLNKINYKFRLDWNYHSNHLEGGTLTKEETRSVMVDIIDIRGKSIKDVMEMKGHNDIITEIINIGKGEKRISEKRILDIHTAIMHEEDAKKRKEIGKWKTKPNEIINYKGEKINFAKPEKVKEKLHDLLNKTNAKLDLFYANKKTEHPIIIATNFHIEFLSIHPFYDGNGRTARILTNLILISCGFPPIIIKNNVKDEYYKFLADIQVYGGNMDLLEIFLSNRLLESQQLILDALDGKNIEETDDIDKEITLFKKQLAVKDEVITIDDGIIYNLYINSIEPLFDEFIKKHRQFEELFSKNIIENLVNNETKERNNKFELTNHWIATYNNHGFFGNENMFNELQEETISELNLKLLFNGFKRDDDNTFNTFSNLNIKFNKIKYIIKSNFDKIKPIEKLYSEQLTEKEIKQIVNLFVKNLFERIKTNINNKGVNHG